MLNILSRSFNHNPFTALDEVMNLMSRENSNGNCCTVHAPAALAIDIRERKSDFIVEASLPGFRKDEVDVQMHDGMLTITAHRETSNEASDASAESHGQWIRRERSVTSLARQVRLPEGVSGDGIKAELTNGVLTLQIPKPAQLQPRKISIG